MILSDAEWLARLRRLTHQQQSAVITMIDALTVSEQPDEAAVTLTAADSEPVAASAEQLAKLWIGAFDKDSLAEMEAAIRDCDRIDLDEWK